MATAQATIETITTVTLELSKIEAGVLREILYCVGGEPKGPRGAADSIRRALDELDVERVGEILGCITISKGE